MRLTRRDSFLSCRSSQCLCGYLCVSVVKTLGKDFTTETRRIHGDTEKIELGHYRLLLRIANRQILRYIDRR